MSDLADFGKAVGNLAGVHNTISGQLGYMIGGVWRVVDPDEKSNLLVRFPDGTHLSCRNDKGVAPKYDMWVIVGTDHIGRPVILDEDRSLNQNYHPAGGASASVPFHTHARGSGMEYIFDEWMLKHLRVTSSTSSMTVTISAGAYLYHHEICWKAAGTLDLTAFIPSGFNNYSWIVVGLDPATETFVASLPTAETFLDAPIADPANIPLTTFMQNEYIPLAAVWLLNGDTGIPSYRIEDLRYATGSIFWYLEDLKNVSGESSYEGYVLTYKNGVWIGQPSSSGDGGNGDSVGGLLIPPSGIGQQKYDPDGAQVITQIVVQPQVLLIPIEGTLYTFTSGLRVSNEYGVARTITKVKALVGTAPDGDDIIIDVLKNGTTIFTTPSNRPVILDGANSGETTTIEVDTWGVGDYLQVEIVQVGTTDPGSDLTVHVCYT